MVTSNLRIERSVPASPEQVWHALSDSEALATWFWPPRLRAEVSADARTGGTFRIASPVAGMAVGGQYAVVEAPTLMRFSWRWDGDDEETEVRVELSAVEGGTRIVLDHEGFADPASRDDHVTGWSDCLDRLHFD
jgi:uncharacterized protein YndB with AHSA1/START domain